MLLTPSIHRLPEMSRAEKKIYQGIFTYFLQNRNFIAGILRLWYPIFRRVTERGMYFGKAEKDFRGKKNVRSHFSVGNVFAGSVCLVWLWRSGSVRLGHAGRRAVSVINGGIVAAVDFP